MLLCMKALDSAKGACWQLFKQPTSVFSLFGGLPRMLGISGSFDKVSGGCSSSSNRSSNDSSSSISSACNSVSSSNSSSSSELFLRNSQSEGRKKGKNDTSDRGQDV